MERVWNNDSPDGSFGVTSAIELTDIQPLTGQVLHRTSVPADQVAASFSSKSELGLHVTWDWSGPHLVFVAYAGGGIGALDVSNSDAVPGQDPTNPVTFAFGPGYAFARTVVSMDVLGRFSYTPTIDYGGNNGRSALLGSNGLYYAVGNANNGNARRSGPSPNTAARSTSPRAAAATASTPSTPSARCRRSRTRRRRRSASTSSASGDNGADPNKVVEITDDVAATALTGSTAQESFRVVAGPTYGTAYRGVAFVE